MAVASAVGQAISDYSDTNRVRLVDCTRYGCRLEVLHNKKVYEQTFFSPAQTTMAFLPS
jgi:hypothetical protein